jgi:hypothetical protein
LGLSTPDACQIVVAGNPRTDQRLADFRSGSVGSQPRAIFDQLVGGMNPNYLGRPIGKSALDCLLSVFPPCPAAARMSV